MLCVKYITRGGVSVDTDFKCTLTGPVHERLKCGRWLGSAVPHVGVMLVLFTVHWMLNV
jgi:hypothetical protein